MCQDCLDKPSTTKQIEIDGVMHTVTVLPPGPETHDDVVWRERKTPLSEELMTYDGLGGDYNEYIEPRTINLTVEGSAWNG